MVNAIKMHIDFINSSFVHSIKVRRKLIIEIIIKKFALKIISRGRNGSICYHINQ